MAPRKAKAPATIAGAVNALIDSLSSILGVHRSSIVPSLAVVQGEPVRMIRRARRAKPPALPAELPTQVVKRKAKTRRKPGRPRKKKSS